MPTTGVITAPAVAPVAERLELLPRSGIGVDGYDLVIAPPGNPVIRLDARLLDRIELIGRSPVGALVLSAAAMLGVVVSAIEWTYFASAGLAYLAYERFTEARRRTRSRDLLLALGDLEVALHVADGPEAAKGHRRSARALHARRADHAARGLRGCEATDACAGRRQGRSVREA